MARIFTILLLLVPLLPEAQVSGVVLTDKGFPASGATIRAGKQVVMADSLGIFSLDSASHIAVSFTGFMPVRVKTDTLTEIRIILQPANEEISEVVVTGTLREVQRMESAVPVEVYTAAFLKRNPAPAIFDALQTINGVRPQLNCNVCNTGDIHINGLEGPYTLVLIDGMPIISSLSSVYGLSGIPTSLVEKIEIVKGPASSLYGSEAVGGMINIITKNPLTAPKFFADVMTTSWKETNIDLGFSKKTGRVDALTGINFFHYGHAVDNNEDGFTDVTLQKRFSIFEKIALKRNGNRSANLAARYFYEDRWGGEMNWERKFRGGDSVYGESIYTSRWELIGNYQFPTRKKLMLSFSFNDHRQNSRYGTTSYIASQQVAFTQLTLEETFGRHELLAGAAIRATMYNDNTPITMTKERNMLPGIFLQDEVRFRKYRLLLGARYDHNNAHGSIFTPRAALRFTPQDGLIFRLNAGTGFRVVNVFTEDHAALTGARKVVISEDLSPERSYNVNLNVHKNISGGGWFMVAEGAAWYTYFHNRIIADLMSNPAEVRYNNLDGHAVSRGASLNLDLHSVSGFKASAGATFQDVVSVTEKRRTRQLLTEKFSATWTLSYRFSNIPLTIDYSGNLYSPMQLPLSGALDPRPEFSPWWSNQNVQLTIPFRKIEFYTGVKNIFNWVPPSKPFLIARAHDPFDKNVVFDSSGNPVVTPENPYALTFDPAYLYAPNQGIRVFAGLRYTLKN